MDDVPRSEARARSLANSADVEQLGRREALRRAAILGGSFVVAAPTVQRLAMGVGHATESAPPPPPEEPPPPEDEPFTAISYIGLVFTCNGTTWRAKWEEGKGWISVVSVSGKWESLPQCPAPSSWSSATGLPGPSHNTVPDKGSISVSTNYIGSELKSVTFQLPSGCVFQGSSGLAKGGGGDTGYCVSGAVDGTRITFTAP